jgi:hypothetical protein
VILERHVFGDAVTIARPVTVVSCDDGRLVTWVAPHSEVAVPIERVPPYTGTRTRTWRPPGMLQLVREGDPFALALLRRNDNGFAGWYVNLQEPLVWTERGYETRDNILDLWRPVDGEWKWKDEDELAAAVAAGEVSAGDAVGIRAAGERAIREVELPTGWETWSPDAELPALRLPPGWDVVR